MNWPLRGWSLGDELGLITAICAVVAVVPFWLLGRGWRTAIARGGFSRRRYQRWFAHKWGVYNNPYLNIHEPLSLDSMYVSLSCSVEGGDAESRRPATDVLAGIGAASLVVLGDPGSGKSTLLSAYGVSACQRRAVVRSGGRRVVPFLVSLPLLSAGLDAAGGLGGYLTSKILVSGASLSAEQARRLLRSALLHDQVVVMLDGLDEVAAERLGVLRDAVGDFMSDADPSLPTSRASVIITCRRQNYMALRAQWSAVSTVEYGLAPLTDAEIFSYLTRLRAVFTVDHGPRRYIRAVRASGTLDLHRQPLVLAMSVGLYAQRPRFDIPSSISALYELMIMEMLKRHGFEDDPEARGGVLRFGARDKVRFLRRFALETARQDFRDFTMAQMTKTAGELAETLHAVAAADARAFAAEIIRNSGLLKATSEEGGGDEDSQQFFFAHRSIHEFLAAEQLRRDDDQNYLVARAGEDDWRQVILFHAAALEEHDQERVNEFLRRVARQRPERAAECLAVAAPAEPVAREILGQLDAGRPGTDGDTALLALCAACMSPSVAVQKIAISRLEDVLGSAGTPMAAINGETDRMLPLLNSLAETDSAERIAALVPKIIARIPDDPRLVEPLWGCLSAPGIEDLGPAGGAGPAPGAAIVRRLLALVTDPDGFRELARLVPHDLDRVKPAARDRAYPFRNGLDPEHNLVTLLALADQLAVTPDEPNRFFEAKLDGQLASVEASFRHALTFSLYPLAQLLSVLVPLAAVAGAVMILALAPGRLLRPYGWATLALAAAAALIPMLVLSGLEQRADDRPPHSRLRRALGTDEPDRVRPLSARLLPGWLSLPVAVAVIPAAYAVAAAGLLPVSVPGYLAAVAAGLAVYVLSLTDMCARGRRYYLYRPNRYVDLYDDPRSRHWVTRAAPADGEAAPAGIPRPRYPSGPGRAAVSPGRPPADAGDSVRGW